MLLLDEMLAESNFPNCFQKELPYSLKPSCDLCLLTVIDHKINCFSFKNAKQQRNYAKYSRCYLCLFIFQSANQEQLLVQWNDLSAIINVQVVAAMMLLLALNKPGNCEVHLLTLFSHFYNEEI